MSHRHWLFQSFLKLFFGRKKASICYIFYRYAVTNVKHCVEHGTLLDYSHKASKTKRRTFKRSKTRHGSGCKGNRPFFTLAEKKSLFCSRESNQGIHFFCSDAPATNRTVFLLTRKIIIENHEVNDGFQSNKSLRNCLLRFLQSSQQQKRLLFFRNHLCSSNRRESNAIDPAGRREKPHDSTIASNAGDTSMVHPVYAVGGYTTGAAREPLRWPKILLVHKLSYRKITVLFGIRFPIMCLPLKKYIVFKNIIYRGLELLFARPSAAGPCARQARPTRKTLEIRGWFANVFNSV